MRGGGAAAARGRCRATARGAPAFVLFAAARRPLRRSGWEQGRILHRSIASAGHPTRSSALLSGGAQHDADPRITQTLCPNGRRPRQRAKTKSKIPGPPSNPPPQSMHSRPSLSPTDSISLRACGVRAPSLLVLEEGAANRVRLAE
eukprot:1504655-Prymnesium_polylepis.1